MSKRQSQKIEVGGRKLAVLEDGDKYKICEQGNGNGMLFKTAVTDIELIKMMTAFFIRGRRRGRAEGRNEVRQHLGNLINNMESVG